MVSFSILYLVEGKIGVLPAPSELYDISLAYNESFMSYKKKVNDDEFYSNYDFDWYNPESKNYEQDTIRVYSLKSSLADLWNILFEKVPFPWVDNKYEKRLIRLVLLILFRDEGNNSDSSSFHFSFEELQEELDRIHNSINNLPDEETRETELKNYIEMESVVKKVKEDYFRLRDK